MTNFGALRLDGLLDVFHRQVDVGDGIGDERVYLHMKRSRPMYTNVCGQHRLRERGNIHKRVKTRRRVRS